MRMFPIGSNENAIEVLAVSVKHVEVGDVRVQDQDHKEHTKL